MSTELSKPRSVSMPGLLIGVLLGAGIALGGNLSGPSNQSIPADLLASPELVTRVANLSRALAQAEADDLPVLQAQIEAFEPGPQDSEVMLFADWWARLDPVAANEWSIDYDAQSGLFTRTRVLRSWARVEPFDAIARATAYMTANDPSLFIESRTWSDPGIQSALIGWDESLSPGVEDWIFDQPERVERQGMMEILAQHRVATRDPETIWLWATSLPMEYARDMVPRVASAIADRDPDLAVRLARELIDQQVPELELIPMRIVTRWAKRDPQAALEWLATLPKQRNQPDAVAELARTWISTDRDGFMRYMSGWAADFPSWLEPAIGLYCRTLMRDDRAPEGLALADRIQREDLRNYTKTLILRFWLIADPDAANRWIDSHEIAEDIVRRARMRVAGSG